MLSDRMRLIQEDSAGPSALDLEMAKRIFISEVE